MLIKKTCKNVALVFATVTFLASGIADAASRPSNHRAERRSVVKTVEGVMNLGVDFGGAVRAVDGVAVTSNGLTTNGNNAAGVGGYIGMGMQISMQNRFYLGMEAFTTLGYVNQNDIMPTGTSDIHFRPSVGIMFRVGGLLDAELRTAVYAMLGTEVYFGSGTDGATDTHYLGGLVTLDVGLGTRYAINSVLSLFAEIRASLGMMNFLSTATDYSLNEVASHMPIYLRGALGIAVRF